MSSVAFYDGADLIGTATNSAGASFVFTLPTGLSLGAHTLTAVATDAEGLSTTSTPVPVTVIHGPPAVALLEPTAGATVPALLPLPLRASASYVGGPLAKVEFYSGATKLGEDTASDPETGEYTLTVRAESSRNAGVTRIEPSSIQVRINSATN